MQKHLFFPCCSEVRLSALREGVQLFLGWWVRSAVQVGTCNKPLSPAWHPLKWEHRGCAADFSASPPRLSKSDHDLLVMRSTDIPKPEGLKSTIALFYYCSDSDISVVHQRLRQGSIPLCMSIATLLSIKNCAHRDTARKKETQIFYLDLSAVLWHQMLMLEILKLILP